MQPGGLNHKTILVLDSAGAPVTGLTLAAFTPVGYSRGYGASSWATWSHGATITEIASGYYALAFTLPPAAGFWRFRITANDITRTVLPNDWEGETEINDLDALYSAVVRPTATISSGSIALGASLPLELTAYRWRTLSIPITGIDFSNYPDSSLRLSIRSKDQTTLKWDAGPSATITTPSGGTAANFVLSGGGAGSTLTLTFPEDCSFFSALAAGNDRADLLWEVTGDHAGNAARTVPIIRSSALTILRREVGT